MLEKVDDKGIEEKCRLVINSVFVKEVVGKRLMSIKYNMWVHMYYSADIWMNVLFSQLRIC